MSNAAEKSNMNWRQKLEFSEEDSIAFDAFLGRRGTTEDARAAATLASRPARPATVSGALPALEFLVKYEAKRGW